MLATAIMAHPQRAEAAERLAERVGAFIVWDERNDEWDTASRAWQAVSDGTGWSLVLQDDALPIDGFTRHVEECALSAPRTCVSLYVGTGKPFPLRVGRACAQAREHGASWLEADSLLWGPAVMLPTEHVAGLLAFSSTLPYDQRIGAYYRTRLGLPVRYTWPCLVDHADTGSILDHGGVARRARSLETPHGWTGPVVQI